MKRGLIIFLVILMHRLDNIINDIEPRIVSICDNAPREEEPSLQETLTAYGWILLDSWIAWRTLRFLLRETYIDETVHDKWFQTPASYTASQLKAVWKISELVLEYIKDNTGKSFKELIDKTVQDKRNASAHFSKKKIINGSDSQEIRRIFGVLSKVFLLYENDAFQKKLGNRLLADGYSGFCLSYSNGGKYIIENFNSSINDFAVCELYSLMCYKDDKEYIISFEKNGCKAGFRTQNEEGYSMGDVINLQNNKYCFLSNKGFYLNFDLFYSTVKACWRQTDLIG